MSYSARRTPRAVIAANSASDGLFDAWDSAVVKSNVRIANSPTKRLRNIAIYGLDLLEAESQTFNSLAFTSTSVGSCNNTEGFSVLSQLHSASHFDGKSL